MLRRKNYSCFGTWTGGTRFSPNIFATALQREGTPEGETIHSLFFKYGPSSASFFWFIHFKAFCNNDYNYTIWQSKNISASMRLASLPGLSQQQEGVQGRCHCCFLAILNKSGRLPSHADNPVDTMFSWCSVESISKLTWLEMLKAKVKIGKVGKIGKVAWQVKRQGCAGIRTGVRSGKSRNVLESRIYRILQSYREGVTYGLPRLCLGDMVGFKRPRFRNSRYHDCPRVRRTPSRPRRPTAWVTAPR